MLGLGDEFSYFECSNCGCLQIGEIPDDMSKYYSGNYHSLISQRAMMEQENRPKKYLRKKRDQYTILGKGHLGRVLQRLRKGTIQLLYKPPKAQITRSSKILDVGCGAGDLLYILKNLGFTNILGIDPYISNDIVDKHLRIFRKTIHDLTDEEHFDWIIFRHSFEHMSDQLGTLLKAQHLLSEFGTCSIEMPIKSKSIWGRYGVNWAQIDAPRHFFLHTLSSFELLTQNTNLHLSGLIFNSSEFQFWASEQNRRGIPLAANNSYFVNPRSSIFKTEEIKNYRIMAAELNVQGRAILRSFIS